MDKVVELCNKKIKQNENKDHNSHRVGNADQLRNH